MQLAHVALWTKDLAAAAEFWEKYFHGSVGEEYRSSRRDGFASRFVRFPESSMEIEIMTGPWIANEEVVERAGWDHIAICLRSKSAVDELAARCKADGVLRSGPRITGDGFYEAVILMPDGTPVEITA